MDYGQIKEAKILIASAKGCLYAFDVESTDITPVFDNGEFLMGLAEQDGAYFLSGHTALYKITEAGVQETRKMKPRPNFHHIHIFHDRVHATATRLNEIWVFDLDLNLLHRVPIAPPLANKKAKPKYNYNHLNNIYLHDRKYYVCLNWLTHQQYGPSGVAVLDGGYRELERFEYSWQSHAFSIVDDRKYALCAAASEKQVRHPKQAGLLVEGELVFDHDPEANFCKDFSIDGNQVMVVGGEASKRAERAQRSGAVYLLDREFHLKFERHYPKSGAFTGVMFQDEDLTRPWTLSNV